MYRFCLFGLVLAIALGSTLGCGDSGPKKEEKDPFKARQEAAPPSKKEKQSGGFMKPD
jgi:hypothetical protein